jgi:hypothetical protein
MRYTDAIRNGLGAINRNWQLVLIQMGAMFASFIGFFILVGIPLAIAFIIFGLDLTELSRIEDVFRTFREPSEILSKYFALVILVLTSLLLYITVVLAFGIFLFGGSIGVISRFIEGRTEKFHTKVFFSEGRRLFFPLAGFTSIIGLIFLVVAFVLGLLGGLVSGIVSMAKEQEATLALFLGIFFSLILFVTGLILVLATLSVTVYGSAIMAMRGVGPVKAFKEAVRYVSGHSDAFYLYCLVFVGYLFIIFIVASLSYPIGLIPLIGSFMAIMYQLAAYLVQSYLGLVMIAAIFWYYHISTAEIPHGEETSPQEAATAEGSSEESGTSGPQAHGQGDLPPGTGSDKES